VALLSELADANCPGHVGGEFYIRTGGRQTSPSDTGLQAVDPDAGSRNPKGELTAMPPTPKSIAFDPRDLEGVRAALQIIADANYPIHHGAEFIIRTALGPVVIAVIPFRPPETERIVCSELDVQTSSQSVRESIQAPAEGAILKGDEIAQKIDCECSGEFRGLLASRARRGALKKPAGGGDARRPFLNAAEVLELLGYQDGDTLARLMRDEGFPPPSYGHRHARRWRATVVDDWIRRQEKVGRRRFP